MFFKVLSSPNHSMILMQGIFRLNIRVKLPSVTVVRHWNRFLREAVDVSSLEMFKVRLDGTLNWSSGSCPCPTEDIGLKSSLMSLFQFKLFFNSMKKRDSHENTFILVFTSQPQNSKEENNIKSQNQPTTKTTTATKYPAKTKTKHPRITHEIASCPSSIDLDLLNIAEQIIKF